MGHCWCNPDVTLNHQALPLSGTADLAFRASLRVGILFPTSRKRSEKWGTRPTWCLFYLKTVFLMVAYVNYLIPFLWSTFSA